MAKRRNLKKEKALRNEAYARKFRKRNRGRGNSRRSHQDTRSEENTTNNEENTTSTAAAD
ncbi:hypothetical protein [Prochlorothrix hollandica]|uniref:Uncharacterized protein n=1 Tax=Prochlorothrix hollandica PCC 9006 = CALU 1027 TaxID=317619 RepID=A0A0M2PV58_PROHO|nr:hypothetical protein [Prochlorothrix hollandica]KKI99999.1 hypothetical protein PROH_09470 [Prochlorothrix hollandica PCC 9006 = CALU 1027]